MLGSQRHLFDIPDEVAYLNCSYLAPQLRSVTAAGREAVAGKEHPWELLAADFFTGSEQLRALAARVAGTDGDALAFVPSVSYGVGVAVANLPLQGRDVLVLEEEFPSDVYPWLAATDQAGTKLITVARPRDHDWTAAILEHLDERVAVVAVPHCHWTDGSRVDLEAVGRRAREVGAGLVVDATQSLGALPLDLAAVQPDFLVAAGYKWLLGPYSLGYLYAAPQHREGVPLESNWINRENSQDFARLVDYRAGYQPGARRYDVGERSNFTLVPMAHAALSQLLEWGIDEVAETTARLTTHLAEGAAELGLHVAPRERRGPHMMGLRFPAGVPQGLPERLAAERIYVSVRSDSVRVSPHVYNTTEDCDRLLAALRQVGAG